MRPATTTTTEIHEGKPHHPLFGAHMVAGKGKGKPFAQIFSWYQVGWKILVNPSLDGVSLAIITRTHGGAEDASVGPASMDSMNVNGEQEKG